jgi:hypothetical protein
LIARKPAYNRTIVNATCVVESAGFLIIAVCVGILSPAQVCAQNVRLFVTGLPCPGGQGEPTNSHPLVWQCRSAADKDTVRTWWNWQETIPVEYGDVISATWFGECRNHSVDWPFLRVDLVRSNLDGVLVTNSSNVKMRGGYDFAVSYIYWYTNGASIIPTSFDVAQIAVMIGSNSTPVVNAPFSFQGTNISPPIWQSSTNPITDPANWPAWGKVTYPKWPEWVTNADGALVISPSAQLPICKWGGLNGNVGTVELQGLPGSFIVQSATNLSGPWIEQTNVIVGADGTAKVSFSIASLSSRFIRAAGSGPAIGLGYTFRLGTSGDQFQPAVYCDSGTPQEFLWNWADGTTSSDFPIAWVSFGTFEPRSQTLRVYPPDVLTAINLGFDGSDGGETTPLSNRPPQEVTFVYFPFPLTSLRYWASSYNPVGDTLDFTGFTSLEAIECFHCSNIEHVVVAKLPSLKRICFEQCNLQELDLNGDPNLEDVRAALNAFSSITLGAGTGPKIWHFCTRENFNITQDFREIMTNFFSLREPWIWHNNQSGALKFVSTNLTDVETWGNYYTFADFSGQTNLQICWVQNNLLTNILMTGCVGLQNFQGQNNQLPSSVLDALLTELDNSCPDLAYVDLTMNAEFPSAIGFSHYSNLTNRGVTVYVDLPDTTGPAISIESAALVSESCVATNGAIDPDETVTMLFSLKNIGLADTTNLVVTLLATNGVVSPSASQSYGALIAGGAGVSDPFTFMAAGVCGGSITATLQLQDGAMNLGTVSVLLPLGVNSIAFAEDFDSVTVPSLPSGWTTSATGAESTWATTNLFADTTPNAVFTPDPDDVGLSELVSPPINLPNGPARLTFQNYYDLEPDVGPIADDGGVLEIKIGTNAFTDVLVAGGSFVSGGYTGTITNIWDNPLSGRQAWSGNSGGYITTTVSLPTAAGGQTIQLRWVCATDNGNGPGNFAGWRIDSITITTATCCGNSAGTRNRPIFSGGKGSDRKNQ